MSKFPTAEQAKIIAAHGLMPFAYVVLAENQEGMIVLRYIDGAVKHLRKPNQPRTP